MKTINRYDKLMELKTREVVLIELQTELQKKINKIEKEIKKYE